MNQILKIGAEAFQSQLGEQLAGSLSLDKIMNALAGLLPGEGKNVDLSALVGKMQGGGLASLAESWLGDGGNAGIGAEQLMSIFGSGDIMRFADKLGLDQDTALEGLKGAVPEMVDKASTGGTLESLGGVGGIMGMAGKLFGR
ncbi:MAG TPA: YidB family protein [Wenzhouxiangellaceae bacterium]|nr:YidB family protein [Wenzhouxiangellaceae bacterium]